MELFDTLAALCDVPAVSGFETKGAAAVATYLAAHCDTVEMDAVGNVHGLLRCGKKDAETVLLDAHFDQIGFLVTEVLEGGFLRFSPVGGVDPRMLLGAEVTVLADEPLYGVISCMPPHLLNAGEQNKAVQIQEMLIDTGLHDATTRIPIGTPIVFAQKLMRLHEDVVAGKCLDDRAGVLAILYAMEKLRAEKTLDVNVAVLISVQEEVTGLGATVGAFAVQPAYGIAVDVTHAKTPDGPSDGVFELGAGAAIGIGPNMHRALTKRIIETAKAHDLPHALEIMEGDTGTNAWLMQIAGRGIAMALLSIPQRYMHTPIETIKLADVQTVGELIYQFVRAFDGEVHV